MRVVRDRAELETLRRRFYRRILTEYNKDEVDRSIS